MDQKQAEKEIEYRIGKILLATMMAEGLISQSESDVAQCYLMKKIQPPIGSLEPPNGA